MSGAFKSLFSNVSRFNELISDNVGGMRLVQAFTNEGYELSRFKKVNDNFRATKLKAYSFMSWNITISHIAQKLTMIFVLIMGSYFVLNGSLSYGGFVAFIMITNLLFKPLEAINMIIELFPKGIAGFKNFKEIVNMDPEIKDSEDAVEFTDEPDIIEYENVSFKYGEKLVLDQLSIKIEQGEKIALVGPSGGGKTTICSLLPRFYDPIEGAVKINNKNIKSYTLESLRKQIGVVQQDVFLFGGTLRDNIIYGNLNATEVEINEAVDQRN